MAGTPGQDPADPGPQVHFDQELTALQKAIRHTEQAIKGAGFKEGQQLSAQLKQLKQMQLQMTQGMIEHTTQDLLSRAPGLQQAQPDPSGQMIQDVMQGGWGR